MRTMQRAAAVVGLTLITGGVFGFAATAATAAPNDQATESTTASTTEAHRHDGDRDRFRGFGDRRDRSYTAGYFRSREACRWWGWIGEKKGKWEDPRCFRIGRNTWVLRVEPDHDRWDDDRRGRGRGR
jgi:hypothetical protein